ncbi:MAG: NAD-dependent epimerase/dehydratase family protein, partial [Saccharopolyspora rectivirgula]
MSPNVVLVTGVSRFLGGHLAARLAANPAVERIIGVDTVQPHRDLLRRMGRTEFVRADIRNPFIAKVIADAEVDTVLNLTIPAAHAEVDLRAIAAGKNVYSEKPFAVTTEE